MGKTLTIFCCYWTWGNPKVSSAVTGHGETPKYLLLLLDWVKPKLSSAAVKGIDFFVSFMRV
jgi:hypothetical protein